jgi:phage terminase large subunit
VWLWLYWPGAAVGWGSRKEQLVDKIGDPDSIFEKMRIIIRNCPGSCCPPGFDADDHMPYMKIVNPETGATITGEAGDNIGRGGRKLIYFKDESAHYERPEKIEAALADNTNVQIDISSVNGLGNVFHRRREAGRNGAGRRSRPIGSMSS